ncbi:hypothetical protein QJS04_geneDACA022062 [Acorus gramineus]|uniref:Uncharacterized protein n=1 Tax=Acorus gramineus TaxID=55184 RepID=A0AAV9B4R8_ACOGR|nr:hypothetical protein QJS04_geneDACA022062 [Acorus gramineus]
MIFQSGPKQTVQSPSHLHICCLMYCQKKYVEVKTDAQLLDIFKENEKTHKFSLYLISSDKSTDEVVETVERSRTDKHSDMVDLDIHEGADRPAEEEAERPAEVEAERLAEEEVVRSDPVEVMADIVAEVVVDIAVDADIAEIRVLKQLFP